MTTTKEELLLALADLTTQVDATDDEDADSVVLRTVLQRVKEMQQRLDINPLRKKDRETLRAKLTTVYRTRYNNYKNGTKVRGEQVRPPATLRVHYTAELEERVSAMCRAMATGHALQCCGVVSPENANGQPCPTLCALDPRDLHPEQFPLDHWFEQDRINEAMRLCLEQVCEGHETYTVAHVRTHYKETPRTEAQRKLHEFVHSHLDIELYRRDLYSVDNLFLRCIACTTASKPTRLHPQPANDRYIL